MRHRQAPARARSGKHSRQRDADVPEPLGEHSQGHANERARQGEELPLKLPTRFQTALQSLYGHYEKTFKLVGGEGHQGAPCFILVCQNTAISKLVYDFISGFHRRHGCYWRLEEFLGKLRRPFYDVVR